MIVSNNLGAVKRYFDLMPDVANKAASMAINSVAGGSGLAIMRKDIETQVNFPRGYINDDKLGVVRRASPTNLVAVIRARDRATSLARFASNRNPSLARGKPITVEVKRGKRTQLKKAFLVKLRNGNIGLAVRLKAGDTLRNRTDGSSVKLGKNTYLLYGPSVEQVFNNVAEARLPDISDKITKEFLRQFTRLSNG